MRELNQALILDLIREGGQISRADIAKRTSLSRSTVSNIVNDLVAEQRLSEIGAGVSSGGRRPILLEFNYRSAFVIGIELATDRLNVLLTDLQAVVVAQHSEDFDIAAGPVHGLAQLKAATDRVLATLGNHPVVGVGVGVPGPLAYTRGSTIAPPIMPGWGGVPLREELQHLLQLPVHLDNDANLGALAEQHLGVGQGVQNMAFVLLASTGIGAGLVMGGAIYRGEIGSAGEIGHLTIDEDGPRCRCGSFGCLESMAAIPAILERAAALGIPASSFAELLAHAEAGHAAARQLLTTAGGHIGVAIASLLNLYNPGLVVLGGPLAAAGDLLLDAVRLTARERALAIALEHCQVVRGTLGINAVALGAASHVIQAVFRPPMLAAWTPPHIGHFAAALA